MNNMSMMREWKKFDNNTAKTSDGSKVWYDKRELIGYEKSDGYYITLGAVNVSKKIVNDINSKKGIIKVYLSNALSWEKDGHIIKKKISGWNRRVLLKNISYGMKSLGYIVKYSDIKGK